MDSYGEDCMRHNPRCAIFSIEPGLRDDNDCNCGAIPPLPSSSSFSLEQAIERVNRRKQDLAYLGNKPSWDWGSTTNPSSRESELDQVLELLRQVTCALP